MCKAAAWTVCREVLACACIWTGVPRVQHAQGQAPTLGSYTGGGLGYAYGITNIEYTEFRRLGIRDEAQSEGSRLSVFPANTNVLYLGLKVPSSS